MSSVFHRPGHTRARGGAAAVIIGGMIVAALPLSGLTANAAVRDPRSIEVFLGSNLVALTGYPASEQVHVEVLRGSGGFTIAEATKTTDADGVIEMNHVGAEGDDCFDPPSSPDIVPGDRIRTTIAGETPDVSTVRGVDIANIEYGVPNARSITVTGKVALTGATKVVPGADVLELRINKASAWAGTGRIDKRDDIAASVNPDGSFSHVMTGSAQDVNQAQAESETFLEWSSAADAERAFPSELTVAEFGPVEVLPGCPKMQQFPTRPRLAAAMDSAKRGDHITNRSTNLSFAGLVGEPGAGADATLFVDGTARRTVTANGQGVYSFTGVTLTPRAKAYSVKVRSQGTGGGGAPFVSAVRSVTVDKARPTVRVRSFRPNPLHLVGRNSVRGVYRIGERSLLQSKVQHLSPRRTVRTFRNRNVSAGRAEVTWNGKSQAGRDVRRGRYQFVLTVTDRAGNVTVQRNSFRVVR